jgi:hypothetical protein
MKMNSQIIIITPVFLIKKKVQVKKYLIFTKLKKQECKSLNNGKMHASNKNLKKFKN